MRYFYLDGVYAVEEGQYTQDEKDVLVAEACSALDIAEGDKTESRELFDGVSSIITCAPSGAVELTDEQIERHVSGLYEFVGGKQVEKDTSKTDEEIEALRQTAYSNTSTGSDRLFIEYQAAIAQGSDTAEDKKTAWLARRDEIKAEHPFNE